MRDIQKNGNMAFGYKLTKQIGAE